MRAFMVLFMLAGVAGCVLFGLDILTISSRPGATILQQAVAYLGFGFSALATILAAGFYGLAGGLQSLEEEMKNHRTHEAYKRAP